MKLTRRDLLKTALAGAAMTACSHTRYAHDGSPRPQRLLILGGTNFIGPYMVDYARERGHEVTLFNRGKTNPGRFKDVEQLHGDRDGHLEALAGRSWDAVIDNSGYVPRLVEDAAKLLAASVEQYVFVSSISVYDDLSKGADETTVVTPLTDPKSEDVKNDYGALKAACERAAERVMPGRVLKIRPGFIVGPNDPTDRFTYWPVRLQRGGAVLAPGDGKDHAQVIDVRDLAEWTVRSVEARRVGVYNAVGYKDDVTFDQMLATISTVTGSKAQLSWVSYEFLQQQGVSPWSDMPVWGPRSEVGLISNARARKQGLTFRPLETTVRDTLAWWNSLPRRDEPLHAGITPKREAEVLDAWNKRV